MNLRIPLLLASTACSLGLPVSARAQGSCPQFFANLAPGAPGSCADFSFFGFNGVEVGGFNRTRSGASMAAINLFEEITIPPEFFDPLEPVFASVEVNSAGATGIPRFSIEHQGRVSMFPLSSEPPPGSTPARFIATSSQNRTIFRAHDPEPGIQNITLDIKLEQDFELVDPVSSGIVGDVGASFRVNVGELETGEMITELFGSAKFDSTSGPEPEFDDEFAPGYDGFTDITSINPGRIKVDFERTLEITVEENLDIRLETLVTESIFTDGFDSGDAAAWISDSGNAFTVTVQSQNPGVTFDLTPASTPPLVVPILDIARLPDGQVRLSWDALDTQSYTVLFTPDPALSHDQWEERATIAGTMGVITRDFPIAGPAGFFAVRTTSP